MYRYLMLIILFCANCDNEKKLRGAKGAILVPSLEHYNEDEFISDTNHKGENGEDIGVKVGIFGKPEYNMVHLLKSVAVDKDGELIRRSGSEQVYSAKLEPDVFDISEGSSVTLLSLGHPQIDRAPILTFEPYNKADNYLISLSLLEASYSTSDDTILLKTNRGELKGTRVDSIYLTSSGQKNVIKAEFSSKDYIFSRINFKKVDEKNYSSTKLSSLLSSTTKEVEFVKKYSSAIQTKKGLRPIDISIDESDNRVIKAKLAALKLSDVTILGELGVTILDGLDDLKIPSAKTEGEEIYNQVYIIPDNKVRDSLLCYVTVLFKGNLLKLTYRMKAAK